MRSEPSARSPAISTSPARPAVLGDAVRPDQADEAERRSALLPPDDVDLLRGIRRLLYGEGYTIRGVQRILKEHGIKSVQGLADGSVIASFGAIEEVIGEASWNRTTTLRPASTSMTTIMTARTTVWIFGSPNPMKTESRPRLKAARFPTWLVRRDRSTPPVWKVCCRT